MKFLLLLLSMLFIKGIAFSQWAKNEDPLTLKELHLTKIQQKQIKKINYNSKAAISELEKQYNFGETLQTKIDSVTGSRIKNIRNYLTVEQNTTWRNILMTGKPRRGVTNLPNERILNSDDKK